MQIFTLSLMPKDEKAPSLFPKHQSTRQNYRYSRDLANSNCNWGLSACRKCWWGAAEKREAHVAQQGWTVGLSKDDPVAYHVQVEHQEGLHTPHEEVSDIQQRFPEYLLSRASSGMLSKIKMKLKSYRNLTSRPIVSSKIIFISFSALFILSRLFFSISGFVIAVCRKKNKMRAKIRQNSLPFQFDSLEILTFCLLVTRILKFYRVCWWPSRI